MILNISLAIAVNIPIYIVIFTPEYLEGSEIFGKAYIGLLWQVGMYFLFPLILLISSL